MTFQEIKTLVSNSANLALTGIQFVGMLEEVFSTFCSDTSLYKNNKVIDISQSSIDFGGKILKIYTIKNTEGNIYNYTMIREADNDVLISIFEEPDMTPITTGKFYIYYSYIPTLQFFPTSYTIPSGNSMSLDLSFSRVNSYANYNSFPTLTSAIWNNNKTYLYLDQSNSEYYYIKADTVNATYTYEKTFISNFIFPDEYLKGIISALLAQAYLRKSEEYMKNEDIELHNIFSEKATYYNNIYSEVRKKCIKNTENMFSTLPDVKQHDLGDF